ncbi:MAG: tyrosine-protein phosphatase [Gammaproteobacteria bacterium]|nr:tyrosine-protein phosphatase [Gammaproteobacteria bacterium]
MQHVLKLILLIGLTSPAFAGDVLVDLDVIRDSGQVTAVDGVSSSGQPDEAAFEVFAENGYKTVIDLRTPGEGRGLDEPGVVEELGMTYVSLPIGRTDINYESAQALDELIAGADGPVLLHCGSGNRVGALLALRASLKGASDAESIVIGEDAGLTSLKARVGEALTEK